MLSIVLLEPVWRKVLPIVPNLVEVGMVQPEKRIVWRHHSAKVALLPPDGKVNHAMWGSFDKLAELGKGNRLLDELLHRF